MKKAFLSSISGCAVFIISFLIIGCGGNQRPYSPIIQVTQTGTPSFSVLATQLSPTYTFYDFVTGKERPKGAPGDVPQIPGTASFPISVTSVNGFQGTVTLEATLDQNVQNDFTVSFSPATLTFTGSGTKSATLNVSIPDDTYPENGNYTWTVQGNSGTAAIKAATHPEVTMTTSPPYTVAVTPASETINIDEGATEGNNPANYTVTVAAKPYYTGTVDVFLNSALAGFSNVVNPQTVTLTAAQPTQTTTLTLTVTNFTDLTPLNTVFQVIGEAPPGYENFGDATVVVNVLEGTRKRR